jgi:Alpha-glutamyl/putrescinyl thymine pyrophosphorylase clade 3
MSRNLVPGCGTITPVERAPSLRTCNPAGAFASSGCAPQTKTDHSQEPQQYLELREKTRQTLAEQGIVLEAALLDRFVSHLDNSIHNWHLTRAMLATKRHDRRDIICLIREAIDLGDLNEALWRAFLAIHFGRCSANPEREGQFESAAMFLCAFGEKPMWTWTVVRAHPELLQQWLHAQTSALAVLSFGNHRKREQRQPAELWKVVDSFLSFHKRHGDKLKALLEEHGSEHTAAELFDLLYKKFLGLYRFDRLGSFDFVELLAGLGLTRAEPAHCYLVRNSGPFRGAVKLWNKTSTPELNELARRFSEKMGLSPAIVEDCLCNWQKNWPSPH